jgi:hypothetical protein
MPPVNQKVIAAGWAAASWIRARRASWDDPRLDGDKKAAARAAAEDIAGGRRAQHSRSADAPLDRGGIARRQRTTTT